MRLKRLVFLSVLVFAGIGAIVYGFNRLSHRHDLLQKVSLRLQWIHQSQFAGFYVAKEKGFYARRGIDLSIHSGGLGFNAPLLVANKQDDFGIWVADQVLTGFDKQHLPIRAIGTVYNRSLAGFMVRAESTILTPNDFVGKTVGIYHGFDTETLYQELLSRFHVDRSRIIEYPAAYNIQPFIQRQVDVWPSYVINEPLTAEENGMAVRVLTPDQFSIHYYSDTIIVHDDTLREKRDLVERFLEASEEGWREALSHPDDAVGIVLRYDPSLKPAHETRMLAALTPYLNSGDPLFRMNSGTWESMGQILKRQGGINDASSFKRLCDFEVATDAHKDYH